MFIMIAMKFIILFYPRDKFSFHLEPFEIDSLDDYSGAGLSFAGVFRSAGIFLNLMIH